VVIVGAIENTDKYAFDTSTNGLINLTKNSVDEEIVVLMITKQKEFNENSLQVGNILINEPGLYLIDSNEVPNKISPHLSDPNGISMFSVKIQLKDPNSNSKYSKEQSVFYYYSKGQTANNSSSYIVPELENPNEAILIKFKEKKRESELEIGKIKIGGFKMSIPNKNQIKFKVEEIKPNIYKIILEEKLEEGEYAFIFGGIQVGVSKRVFDFSIK